MINEYVYSIDQFTYTQRRGHTVNVINSLTEPFSLRKAIHRKKNFASGIESHEKQSLQNGIIPTFGDM